MTLLLLFAFAATPPQTDAQSSQELLRPVPVQLVVNDVMRDEVIVRMGDETIWVPVASLEGAGLIGFAGDRRDFPGGPSVELGSLAPDINGVFELADVSLRIVAAPRFFARNDIDIVDARPRGMRFAHSPSAHLNYAVNWNTTSGTSFFGEASASIAGHTMTSGFSVDADGSFRRGFSSAIFDQPGSMRRWVIGDTSGRAGLLGSAPVVGGVRVGREYSLDPYYLRYATPLYAGTVSTPSTVEIFIDGQPGQRFNLPPGHFQIGRLPVSSGLGDIRVVVRDVFGREQVFDSSYYLATEILKHGEQDYEYLAGFERRDGIDGAYYGGALGTARHRYGVTDGFTLGYRFEMNEEIINGGPTMNFLLGRLGATELYLAASSGEGRTGHAVAATYAFTTRSFGLSAFARWRNASYGDLFLSPTQPRDDLLIDVLASVPLFSRGSLSVGFRRSEVLRIDGDDGPIFVPIGVGGRPGETVVQRAATLRASVRLAARAQLLATATRGEVDGERWWAGSVALTFAIGRRTSASVAYDRDKSGVDVQRVDINRSLPIGPGIGYRASASSANDGFGFVELDAQTKFGRAALQYDLRRGEPAGAIGRWSGSVVAIGGVVTLARPIDAGAGFALVSLPGAPGVEVFYNNQPVGRTNRGGKIFVPDLLPYHANTLSFDDDEVPFDLIVEATSEDIAPPFRGGAVLEFPLRRLHAFKGSVVVVRDGDTFTPEYGDLLVEMGTATKRSPLTRTGHFYLEDLVPGLWPATIRFSGEQCSFAIQVPESDQPTLDLGTLRCELR